MELTFHHPEFEKEVYSNLSFHNRPITEKDALGVTELDLSNFDFSPEDQNTLSLFRNLISLDINIGQPPAAYWHSFSKLKYLHLCCLGDIVDFTAFRNMTSLEMLWVSGGDHSNIDYLNLEALTALKHLHYLELHEFGTVDLFPLCNMPQLKELSLRYANKVFNIGIIGAMRHLKELTLDGLHVDDLKFLDSLPDSLYLEMCGIHVYFGVDPHKWKRFAQHDIHEITVKDNLYAHIDLSVLDD